MISWAVEYNLAKSDKAAGKVRVSLEISKIRRATNSPQGPRAGKQQGVIYVDYFDSFAGGSVVGRRRLRLQPLALSGSPFGPKQRRGQQPPPRPTRRLRSLH